MREGWYADVKGPVYAMNDAVLHFGKYVADVKIYVTVMSVKYETTAS